MRYTKNQLEELFDALTFVFKNDRPFVDTSKCWTFYGSISGFHKDSYYHLNVSQWNVEGEIPKVVIYATSKKVKTLIKMIKAVDNNIRIEYTKKITTIAYA
tara:strand:- start:1065 stop:1367 length:303 start_codon:yes stop_codon:yes gene_type:complete